MYSLKRIRFNVKRVSCYSSCDWCLYTIFIIEWF